jgi:regulator of protease activity HflC (stomatin/prohibitin superfamily)
MEQAFNRMGKFGGLLFAGGVAISQFFFVVDAGERAVVFNKIGGVKEKVYGEGMHFKIPILWAPTIFEVRTRPQVLHSTTGTRDLQTVDLSLRILYRPVE